MKPNIKNNNIYHYNSLFHYPCETELTPLKKRNRTKENEHNGYYFKVHLENPKTSFYTNVFLSLAEAEQNAFEEISKYLNCKNHSYVRLEYSNSTGICLHCNMKVENAFEPLTTCEICNQPTLKYNEDGFYHCEIHANEDLKSAFFENQKFIHDLFYMNQKDFANKIIKHAIHSLERELK
jgi:hypothetical protein